jgi:hypothetical protein
MKENKNGISGTAVVREIQIQLQLGIVRHRVSDVGQYVILARGVIYPSAGAWCLSLPKARDVKQQYQ